MRVLRRLLAIALLLLVGLPFAAPLLAQQAAGDALPACCRKDGKHHCMMDALADGSARQVRAVGERCPYCPASVAVSPHGDAVGLTASALLFGELVRHPAVVAQVAARGRVARDRARGVRGPPVVFSA